MHENRIYFLKLTCGPKYPQVPPIVQFKSKVNATFINQSTGHIIEKDLPVFYNWNPNFTMETVLSALRQELASPVNKKLAQPPEGSTFSC